MTDARALSEKAMNAPKGNPPMTTTNQGRTYRGGSVELLIEVAKDIATHQDKLSVEQLWEVKNPHTWCEVNIEDLLNHKVIIRRRPVKRITIGSHSFPEPVREADGQYAVRIAVVSPNRHWWDQIGESSILPYSDLGTAESVKEHIEALYRGEISDENK